MMQRSSALKIVINGRFCFQKLSGVQRYSMEMVRALDGLIAEGHGGLDRHDWRLIIPSGAQPIGGLKAINVEERGRRRGHLWEQLDLLKVAYGARLVNLGNSGPVLHRDKIVVIHDASVFRTPDNFDWRYRTLHGVMSWAMARTARLGTVSEFSRRELSQVLRVAPDSIFVACNGADHLCGRERSNEILSELGLTAGRYFVFVGSPAPNKNLATLLEAFAQLDRPEVKLVVAGSLARGIFGGKGLADMEGVVAASGRNDAEIAALYAGAAAHVFPSLYEGFGIPPLEALANGCPTIVGDIPVLREVCADAASYFPPKDAEALAALMRVAIDDPQAARAKLAAGESRVAHFTWRASAERLAQAIVA